MEKIEDIEDQTYQITPQNMQESYKIEIKLEEKTQNELVAYLYCQSYISFLRALETLFQLIDKNNSISDVPLLIEDEPSYKWRGIMLDTTRHFLSVENILKQIEALQVNKMNVLHIHFTDSESFPVQIPEIPELSEYGAYSQDQVYTQYDIAKIEKACKESGISLIPEFDTPAHTRSWANSPKYSDTNACSDYPPQDWELYCAEPPCGALDPTIENTWELIKGVSQYMQQYFSNKNMHMGGDEIFEKCWEHRPEIKQWMDLNGIKNYKELEMYFREKQASYFQDKNLIYWLNGASGDVKFRENDLIQYWDEQSTYDMLKKFDNEVILSTYDYLYLDCGQGDQQGWDSWCDPYKTWKHIYQFDPKAADIGDRVIGAEACLWAEIISNDNLDNRAWPRVTSLALRLWNVEENLNSRQLVEKLVNMNKILKESYDMKPSPITTQYCEKNLDMCFFEN
ncbi:Glycoside hydrolase, superfamily [Pseudocohnilembus persalinus]|uniref:beta-N-acetylhexosaminidase n=1 Tax=Pseudocohnilembus persalinus TaxID=266149 RepID=A0A0V0Q7R3_PSEPJ|nr:Glycoside hydrolase, superfamily [Pseudocohnilembus persalinus]|eukprot:KRW98213.1 Glycoside hydrolase, superfamily [Pseudocohnilembus persalinus]